MHGTHTSDTAAAIRALAARLKIAYVETATDVLGHHMTRLADDDVELDFTQIERIMKINELTVITDDVVEAARSTLVIGVT